jgi:hypothetical protein
LLRQRADFGWETNNLLVEAFLVPSVLAGHHDEDGAIRLARQLLGGEEIGVPGRLLLGGLLCTEHCADGDENEQQKEPRIHEADFIGARAITQPAGAAAM